MTTQMWKRGNRWLSKGQMLKYDAEQRGEVVEEIPQPKPEIPPEAPEKPVEPVKTEIDLDMPFLKLKALAAEKGMEVTKKTKKAEVTAFLTK